MEKQNSTAENFVTKNLVNKGSYTFNGHSDGNFYQFEYKLQKSEAAKNLELHENGFVNVPRWLVYFSIPIMIFAVAFFIGALATMASVKTDALYGHSCAGRTCSRVHNLKCIDKICQCESPKYYTNKCVDLSKYGEKCVSRQSCDPSQDMICFGSICSCAPTKYWNSHLKKCVDRLTYGQTCSGDQCRIRINMICSINGICDCIDNTLYFWDNNSKECVLKKRYSLPCTSDIQCLDSQLTICKNNQNCLCTDTKYFNGVECVPRVGEFNDCSFDDMCLSPMFCQASSRKCTCETYHYFDSLISNCVQKHSYLEGLCTSDHHCRQDRLLYCNIGICKCLDDHTWSSNANSCKLTYSKGDCFKTSDCNLNEGLVCYRSNFFFQCNCPTGSVDLKCDCPRTSSNEMYWDSISTKCIEAKTYQEECSNLYECKHITQKLICDQNCICEEPGGWIPSKNVCKKCKNGDFFFDFTGRCYHFSKEKQSAQNSRKGCRNYGATLAKIDAEEILYFLTDEAAPEQRYWIDGERKSGGVYRFYDSGTEKVPLDICSDFVSVYRFLHLRESSPGNDDWCFYSNLARWTDAFYICQY